jgi:hypothetical protein
VWDAPTTRRLAVAAFAAAFAIVLAVGATQSSRRLGHLDHRRDEALAMHTEPVDVASDVAGAFRRFRSSLRAGDRFALVFGDDVDADRRGTYRLVALSYLYPAVATEDPSGADAVMVFGDPSASVASAFEGTGVVDGVWLGRRRA